MGDKINRVVKGTHSKVIVPLGDFLLGRVMSKKLTVFFIATAFVIYKLIDGPDWIEVAKWYFAAQGAVDVTTAATSFLGHKKTEKSEDLNDEQP